jgi:SAM-dependent methyltransferase
MGIQPTATDQIILQRLFGWHTVPWIDAFSSALRHIRCKPSRVLEIGAARGSAPSLFFLQKGASVEVTCYQQNEVRELKRFCEAFCRDHGLSVPPVRTHDIFAPIDETYDLILMKGVLGGVDREHNLKAFSRAVECCLRMVRPGGTLLVLDKGWCSSVHNLFLRGFGAAGKYDWHYFTQKELELLASGRRQPVVIWKGCLSVGVMPFGWLQRVADLSDRYLLNHMMGKRGTVFSAIYKKDAASDSAEALRAVDSRVPERQKL